MRILIGILVMSVMVYSTASHAQDCSDASTQTDMNICAGRSLKKADAALNALYAQIGNRLKDDPDAARLLTVAQRAWIAFRDAECAFLAPPNDGGSITPMIMAQCLERLTNSRVEDFKTYLACEEGDLSCPVPAE